MYIDHKPPKKKEKRNKEPNYSYDLRLGFLINWVISSLYFLSKMVFFFNFGNV